MQKICKLWLKCFYWFLANYIVKLIKKILGGFYMEEYKENENITDTNAIVGMILGILSVILCWVPVIGLVLGIIALILSIK